MIEQIELNFFEPEQIIVKQYEKSDRRVFITGAGLCTVYQYQDSRTRICLGFLEQGTMIGEVQCVFDSDPLITVEAGSYCTVAIISQ